MAAIPSISELRSGPFPAIHATHADGMLLSAVPPRRVALDRGFGRQQEPQPLTLAVMRFPANADTLAASSAGGAHGGSSSSTRFQEYDVGDVDADAADGGRERDPYASGGGDDADALLSPLQVVQYGLRHELRVLQRLGAHPNLKQILAVARAMPVQSSFLSLMPCASFEEVAFVEGSVAGDVALYPAYAQRDLLKFSQPTSSGVSLSDRLGVILDIARAIQAAAAGGVCVPDLSLRSFSLFEDAAKRNRKAVLTDLSHALVFDSPHAMQLPLLSRYPWVGSAVTRLAPEVLSVWLKAVSSADGHAGTVNWQKQPAFSLGLLFYEVLTGSSPIAGYPDACINGVKVEYSGDLIADLPSSLDNELVMLGRSLLSCDPASRMDVADVISSLESVQKRAEESGDRASTISPVAAAPPVPPAAAAAATQSPEELAMKLDHAQSGLAAGMAQLEALKDALLQLQTHAESTRRQSEVLEREMHQQQAMQRALEAEYDAIKRRAEAVGSQPAERDQLSRVTAQLSARLADLHAQSAAVKAHREAMAYEQRHIDARLDEVRGQCAHVEENIEKLQTDVVSLSKRLYQAQVAQERAARAGAESALHNAMRRREVDKAEDSARQHEEMVQKELEARQRAIAREQQVRQREQERMRRELLAQEQSVRLRRQLAEADHVAAALAEAEAEAAAETRDRQLAAEAEAEARHRQLAAEAEAEARDRAAAAEARDRAAAAEASRAQQKGFASEHEQMRREMEERDRRILEATARERELREMEQIQRAQAAQKELLQREAAMLQRELAQRREAAAMAAATKMQLLEQQLEAQRRQQEQLAELQARQAAIAAAMRAEQERQARRS